MRTKNILWITLMALFLTATLPTNITMSAVSPTLYVDPDEVNNPSGLFIVEIQVANVTSAESLYGWQFSLHFNPGLLEITRVKRGPFLRNAVSPYGYTTLFAKSKLSQANFLGVLDAGESVYPKLPPDPPYPPVGAVGDGTVAKIEFKIKGMGVNRLDLDDTMLLTVQSSTPVQISHDVLDGLFDNRLSNALPYADFAFTPSPATEGELMQFDGSLTTDDGWIDLYEWDFDYDGVTFDVDATGEVVFHAYEIEGVYKVGLRVTDGPDGATDIGDYDVQVLVWMEGGAFPDLVGWEAKPEKPKWWETSDGQLAPFNAKVGNPTSQDCEAYVEFTVHSKDQGIVLGTIETTPETIPKGTSLEQTAFLDLTDNTWACLSGSPEWVPYGYYGGGGMRKYAVFARCYYDDGTGYKVGEVVKYFHFNVYPARHAIGVVMWTANATVPQGDILDIYADITNYGSLNETFVVDVTYKGEFAQGIIEQREVTVAAGTTATETFTWDTTGKPLGIYILKVTLPVLTYEYPRDTGDQEDLALVTII